MGNEDFHKISLKKFYDKVESNELGLSMKDAEERIHKYGENILVTKQKVLPIVRFLKQFTNFFAILLMVGAGLAFYADTLSPGDGNIYICIALIVVVFLNATFTFIQEYQSEKIMESFKKMLPSEVDVLRDKKRIKLEASKLVPGDIIFLEEGVKVPADARIIEHSSMKVDNASITGEAEPQLRKTVCTHHNILESRNMLFSGTLVQTGNGKAMVYGTGMNTQIGKIVKLTKETKEVETPLHKELNHFIKIISIIAMVLGVVFFFISLILGKPAIASLVFAIGIIVANVPEGLLPTVTLSLSMAAKRMAKRNALIKNLESVETLGSTTVICTDKTGTLTENNMTLETLFMNQEEFNSYDKAVEKKKGFTHLIDTMILCNNARIDHEGKLFGDPTETALIKFASGFKKLNTINGERKRLRESPFDSKTKRMVTYNKYALKGKPKNIRAYMKGAPEVLIEKCTKIRVNHKVRTLTPKDKKLAMDKYKLFASRGERVLGFGYKDVSDINSPEKGYVFCGLIGMMDPPRKEVPDALKACKTAGIKVIMITGDYSLTAEAIGRKVGLIPEKCNCNIMLGENLEKLSDKKLKEFLKKENIIFARTAPAQKLQIVKALQSMGEVVTVTGDGVNDAPALKNADMGVSMGMTGTEVAREASDLVLMDDNFATIVNAIEEGRTIFENIKKFVAYILTSNIPEILPFIAFVALGVPLPLTVILILAIDLGTDLVPALGLGSEKPEADVMVKKPRSKSERLLTGNLLFMSYGIVGVVQAAAGFATYFFILYSGGWTWGQSLAGTDLLYMRATTGFFASIIIAQVADVLICRTRRQSIFKVGIGTNKLIWFGIFTELALMAFIVFSPFANKFLGTAPLTLTELSIAIPFALLIFFGDELRKVFIRRGNKFVTKYLTW